MAGKSSVVDEAADGVKVMFSRLGEFFHIFDLSFFVSGAATLGALTVLFLRLGIKATFPFADWVGGLAIFVVCYICGLLSFSLGRMLNRRLFRPRILESRFKNSLQAQGLRGQLIERYMSGDAPHDAQLYGRLWQELAEKHPGSVAFSHLSRYWAMAATYDGLAISFLAWAAVLTPVTCLGHPLLENPWLSVLAMIVLIEISALCFYQGGKFFEYQVEDLVAALAVMRVSIDE